MTGPGGEPTRLSASECWRLLEGEGVGRLAVTAADGMPDLFPVNFVSFQGSIYIRTAPDRKVLAISAHPSAAFEVDGETEDGWWSVVVRGACAVIRDPVELQRSGVTRLTTASPRHKQHALKLTVNMISGRRFARRDANIPRSERRSAGHEQAGAAAPHQHGHPQAEEIPSLPPVEGARTSMETAETPPPRSIP